ncbi:putative Acylphosphate phosphohydrolase [Arthrobacter sp. 9AX]|uniref:acylphosphatase n=1 Tax=Arthrobacter sp. 9AX TaxID=2653131 RepID=UPI0012EEF853|nr:acylphosphatase [Arthrobacter sp. 9AX]VXC47184.1 putative Acylphosphate phosphohydrolase [Arthrobacter sp. 9AX]
MARHAGPSSGAPEPSGPSEAEAGAVRLSARVFGVVQGVGFRFWTMGKAEELGLTGEVKNLDDGSVAVVAEGPQWKIHELREWLNSSRTPGRVERVEDSLSEADGTFRDFRAR